MSQNQGKGNALYFNIYNNAHDNAIDLLKEAKLLLDNGYYARAYALAFTALEEISKSQFAADVYTGLTTPEEFNKFYINHSQKIERMEWAKLDADERPKWIGPEMEDVEYLELADPTFIKRNRSLYVDIDDKQKIHKPEGEINKKETEAIIHIVDTALERIWEMTEYWGHQIGTKGFMK